MRKCLVLLGAVILAQVGMAQISYNFRNLLLENGLTPEEYVSGVGYNLNYGVNFVIDGIAHSTDEKKRYLATLNSDETKTASLTFTVPLEKFPSGLTLSSYKVWRATVGWNAVERAPTAWKLFGTTIDGETVEITNTNGVKWVLGASTAEACEVDNSTDKNKYKSFKWVPTDSKICTDSAAEAWKFALMEFELYVAEPVQEGFAMVKVNVIGDMGGVSVTPAATEDDTYAIGTKVTLLATPNEGEKFHRWVGIGIPEGQEEVNPLMVEVSQSMHITPVFEGMWLLDASEKRLYDTRDVEDSWILKIDDLLTSAQTFKVGEKSGAWMGNLYVQGSGDMDLSTPICDVKGQKWSCIGGNGAPFGTTSDDTEYPNGRLKTFIAPKTWTGFNGQQLFNTKISSITNLVLDCPLLSGVIPSWSISSEKMKNLVLKCPKITTIYMNTIASYSSLADTNVSEWDLSGLKYFKADLGFPSYRLFKDKSFYGNLNLPVIEDVLKEVFCNTKNLNEASLGTNGRTLKYIGSKAFGGTCGIKKMTIAPSVDGWTAGAEVLTLKNGLKQVVILGDVPTMEVDGTKFFSADESAEKICCIYLPKLKSWDYVFNAMTEISDEEAAAFVEANPDAEPPVGVVPAEVFGTKYAQYVGYVKMTDYGYGTPFAYGVAESRYDDEVVCSVESGSEIEPGTVVTIQAQLGEDGIFVRWEGLPENLIVGDANSSTVKFVVDGSPVNITMWTQRKWTYVPATEESSALITNSVWKLNVYALNDTDIALGNSAGNTYSAYTGTGSGLLDLSAPIEDASGKAWYLTRFGDWCLSNSKAEQKMPITHFIAPRTLTAWGTQFFNANGGGSALTNVVLDIPEFSGELDQYSFNGHSKLHKVTINAPKATTIEKLVFNSTALEGADANEWNLNKLAIIEDMGLYKNVIKGTLTLPSLRNIGNLALYGTGITNLIMGTDFKIGKNVRLVLGSNSVAKCENLRHITFGPYGSFTNEVSTFDACSAIKDVRFLGRPPSTNFINAIVKSADFITNTTDQLTIRGSKLLSWDRLEMISEPTEEEMQRAPTLGERESIWGVYTSLNGERKAWIIHSSSPHDPKGTLFIVR